jgi:hypothetical protein
MGGPKDFLLNIKLFENNCLLPVKPMLPSSYVTTQQIYNTEE